MAEKGTYGNRWKGLAIPLSKGRRGYFTYKTTKDLVRSAIYIILTTPYNTRIMKPGFGSVFPELLFEMNDEVLKAQIEIYTKEALVSQEPRISKIKVASKPSGNLVDVYITYTINESGERVEQAINFQKSRSDTVNLAV